MDTVNHVPLGKPHALESQVFGTSTGPLWSPDGRYLSYGAYLKPDNAPCIILLPLDGGENMKFIRDYESPPIGGAFQWLANGHELGFINWDKDTNLYFSVLDPDKGEWITRQVPTGDFNGRLVRLVWSDDGKSFYYNKMEDDDGKMGIVMHEVETGKEKYLYETIKGDSVTPFWWALRASRDYNLLAFRWHKNINVFDIKTGNIVEVGYKAKRQLQAPTWSPDGRYLLLKGRSEQGDDLNELYIVSVEDGSTRNLDISKYLPRGSRIMISHDWSPDGKSIAFDIRTWKLEVNLIQNVIPE